MIPFNKTMNFFLKADEYQPLLLQYYISTTSTTSVLLLLHNTSIQNAWLFMTLEPKNSSKVETKSVEGGGGQHSNNSKIFNIIGYKSPLGNNIALLPLRSIFSGDQFSFYFSLVTVRNRMAVLLNKVK